MGFLVAEETGGYGPCLEVDCTSQRHLNLVPLMHQIHIEREPLSRPRLELLQPHRGEALHRIVVGVGPALLLVSDQVEGRPAQQKRPRVEEAPARLSFLKRLAQAARPITHNWMKWQRSKRFGSIIDRDRTR